MRKTVTLGGASRALALLLAAAAAHAAGPMPDEKQCQNQDAIKNADSATQGACLVVNRRKGNCTACHQIAGIPSGNIAPPLVAMKQRFPDKARLRAQISDAREFNPNTVMPPFGSHNILTPDEIDKVVEFVLAL